ncbi:MULTISPECIES: DUF3043 domain-containing protein [unclassified Leucobacter]|uniref:DUF3043 domain-containing protein n=1 Tax=unclassified Leucobacter TaxID=2621730 RepID=UPI00165E04BF|nr:MULTISPECIES: DUF3043 domain-containing protein [unclassified Leucobacter]MBC9928416.1 DUF3043 domain-containing protein [Leucobacter sp. cx-169]MBC9935418.1 DUF3043 domain-containing protein [Leucobacter sp. cx-87]
MARNTSSAPENDRPEEIDPAAGKGRPTPSRKEAEAANQRPLVAGRGDKAATKAQRDRQRTERERARVGMMQGDERYLTPRDKGPQRRYVRDFVDARTTLGEFLIPMMGIVLVLTFIPDRTVQLMSVFVIWGFLIVAVLDAVFLGMQLKKRLSKKFGEENLQPGYRWYAAMRGMQMRVLRMPKPMVKRGKFPA